MKLVIKQLTVIVASLSLCLSGCATPGSGTSGNGAGIGPQISSQFESEKLATIAPAEPKLEVIVPVFDPGLSEAGAKYEETERNVWPDLRRAEANRFAWKLKQALEKTGAFGAVRVTPDANATGDLYVIGRIVESNGENVEVAVEAVDISGRSWYSGVFDHEIGSGFHQDIRNKRKDPYDPVFEEAANRIAVELEDRSGPQLTELQRITELRFGAYLTEEAFTDHLKMDDGRFELASFPAETDPMLGRTRSVRVRDQLFVDGLQERYRDFANSMGTSYLIWQEQSLEEIAARRKVEREAAGKAVLGVLAIGVAALAIAAGGRSNSYSGQTAATTAGVLAGVAGAALLADSFQTRKEAEVHRDALNELGTSIDIGMAPQVIAYEKETVELTGTAKEQFVQWRAFLKKVYEEERTPAVEL